jgi:hypothetical protein
MTNACNYAKKVAHGGHCDCEILAQALGIDPRAISFDYCTRVLQRRWHMTCRHGSPEAVPTAAGTGERWHDIGPVDAVKAILISNDPTED